MSHRLDSIPVLFSVGTKLAYQINKFYYGDIHYVWCAENFDSLKQPPTSNPLTIMKRYLEICLKQDRHCYEITNNLAGILNGAKAKLDDGVITSEQREDIHRLITAARWDAFLPVLYIIPTHLVRSRCIDVPLKDRASNDSHEYKILDLKKEEFQVIDTDDIFKSLVRIPNELIPKHLFPGEVFEKRRRRSKV